MACFLLYCCLFVDWVCLMTCQLENCKPNPGDTTAWHMPESDRTRQVRFSPGIISDWLLCWDRVEAEQCTHLPFSLSLTGQNQRAAHSAPACNATDFEHLLARLIIDTLHFLFIDRSLFFSPLDSLWFLLSSLLSQTLSDRVPTPFPKSNSRPFQAFSRISCTRTNPVSEPIGLWGGNICLVWDHHLALWNAWTRWNRYEQLLQCECCFHASVTLKQIPVVPT